MYLAPPTGCHATTQIIIPSPAPISPCRYVIDPEFGFYGPMAFDVAKILANLILTVFATYGLEATEPHKPRTEQRGERRGEGGADDGRAEGRGFFYMWDWNVAHLHCGSLDERRCNDCAA